MTSRTILQSLGRLFVGLLLLSTVLTATSAFSQAPSDSAVVFVDGVDPLADARAEFDRMLAGLRDVRGAAQWLPEPSEDLVMALEARASHTALIVGRAEDTLAAGERFVRDVRAVHRNLVDSIQRVNQPADAARRSLPNLEAECAEAERVVRAVASAHGETSEQAQTAFETYEARCYDADLAAQRAGARVSANALDRIAGVAANAEELVEELRRGMERAGGQLVVSRQLVEAALVARTIDDVVPPLEEELIAQRTAIDALLGDLIDLATGLDDLPDIGDAIAPMIVHRPRRASSVGDLLHGI